MAKKAYIVVNKQQEREVLNDLEQECLLWHSGEYPTEFMPSKRYNVIFPYAIFVYYNTVYWNILSELEDEEIVFDGRKEEQMSDKYMVSQDFMNELEEWKLNTVDGVFISDIDIEDLPYIVVSWWVEDSSDEESNNRLIAIIRWVNGEDVFEIEKPKKWVVRSKLKDDDGDYWYVSNHKGLTDRHFYEKYATKFDTKEEAQSWANSHQEVVQVEVEI